MLVEHFLAIVSTSYHRDSDTQGFFLLIEFGVARVRVDLVHEVDVQIVQTWVLENKRWLVDVKFGFFDWVCMLQKYSYRDLGR